MGPVKNLADAAVSVINTLGFVDLKRPKNERDFFFLVSIFLQDSRNPPLQLHPHALGEIDLKIE